VAEPSIPRIRAKILDWEGARARVRAWQAAGQRVVFTNGCFDLLHLGHVHYLSAARDLGDRLLIGLNSDASIRRLKGPNRPLQDLLSRQTLLAALECVDAVVPFEEDTPLRLIQYLRPDVLVKGGDYRPDDIVGAEEVRSWGGEVRVLPYLEGYSTTKIERKIRGEG